MSERVGLKDWGGGRTEPSIQRTEPGARETTGRERVEEEGNPGVTERDGE